MSRGGKGEGGGGGGGRSSTLQKKVDRPFAGISVTSKKGMLNFINWKEKTRGEGGKGGSYNLL